MNISIFKKIIATGAFVFCAFFAESNSVFAQSCNQFEIGSDERVACLQNAQEQAASDRTVANSQDIEAECGWTDFSSWLAGCMTPGFIYLGGLALLGGGAVFDFFLNLTMHSGYYSADYIEDTWVVMRDLANITFIFGIIFVAFLMITGLSIAGIKDWKGLSTKLIIIALLLNFSLFFAQVIIDAGNITGSFFKSMVLQNATNPSVIDPRDFNLPGTEEMQTPPSVSATIARAVDPVSLLGIDTINEITNGGKSQSFLFAFNIIYLLVSLSMAFMLFKTGFMFLSRTLALIILMIVSPLAFVLYFLPKGERWFFTWLSSIFTKAFCICIFLFMLFLLVQVLNGMTAVNFQNSGLGWTSSVIFLSINVMITYTILSYATRYTQKFCEGTISGNIGSMLLKTTVGAAALTGGFAARSSIGLGGLGRRIIKSDRIGDLAQSNNRFASALGNTLYSGGEKMYNAKFGLDKGYGDKLVQQSKLRADRADALSGSRKKRFTAEEKERLIKTENDKRMKGINLEDVRTKENYKNQLARVQVVNKNRAAGMSKEDAEREGDKFLQEQANSAIAQIKTNARKQAEAAVTDDQVNEAVGKRSKAEAKAFLEAGKGSAIDWVLAGGVRAYNEASDSYKVFDEGDKRKDREKASLIAEKQKMATANTLTGNDMDREVDKLATIMTDDDLGIMLDTRTIDELRKSPDNKFDTSNLENFLRNALTTKSRDKDGGVVSTFDTTTFAKTMSGFDADMQVMKTKFADEVKTTSSTYEAASAELESLKANQPSNTNAIATAENKLASAQRDKAKLSEKINKATTAIGRKATSVAKEGLKAQLQQATALGTAQYDNAAEESDAAALQAKEGDSKNVDLGIKISN